MNFIGSKATLLPFIVDTINNNIDKPLSECVFCDLFAGTGIVSAEFKSRGCLVYSNDTEDFSSVLCNHYLTTPEDSQWVDIKPNPTRGFIYRNYATGGRKYFTPHNAALIDGFRMSIEKYRNSPIYYWLLASLLNSADKRANTVSLYAAYLKQYKESARTEIKLQPLPLISGQEGYTLTGDANNQITHITGDILYLDPPYNTRQYSSNYHLLNTIADYDYPNIFGKTGMRIDTYASKYSSKKYCVGAFEDLIKKASTRFKWLFMSYNNEGIMSFETIQNIMSQYGEYKVAQREYKRFTRMKEEPKTITEYIHCLATGI